VVFNINRIIIHEWKYIFKKRKNDSNRSDVNDFFFLRKLLFKFIGCKKQNISIKFGGGRVRGVFD
jgi:hypothetical protein